MRRFSFVALLLAAISLANAQGPDPPAREGLLETAFTPGASAKLALGLLFAQSTESIPEWGSGSAGLARRAEWLAAG
jgi:hypothetical protein